MNIIGLIPARGGSKGIVQKNLTPVAGKPLIGYTIEAARQSRLLSGFIVSTDSEAIAACARDFGATVPFMRPAQWSQDHSTAFEVVRHCVDYLADRGAEPELIVYLQPTSPLRTAVHIDEAIEAMRSSDADSLVSVVEVPHAFRIESQMIEDSGYLRPALEGPIGPLRRQDKADYVARNGPAVLITRPQTLRTFRSLYGDKILAYKMAPGASYDIDDLDDLETVERLIRSVS